MGVESILSQVKTIIRSYERLNEANGGNFNIFSVLRIESDEVNTHSRFIAELLNPKGVHGFENQFFELFINTIGIKTKLDINNYTVSVEAYQGKVTDTDGGSIDILVRENGSDENIIMIENKIYAGEQINQLLRYHNAYPKGKLLFLTLDGHDSEQESSKNVDYYTPISYRTDIILWLEECKKVAVNNPTVRETLTQYINLIKKLTNQNVNTKMNMELMELFGNKEEDFNVLGDLKNIDMRPFAMRKTIIPAFEEMEKEFEGFGYNKDLSKLDGKYASLCWVENELLKEKNLNILFQFQHKNTNHLIGGFVYLDGNKKTDYNYTKLQENFRERFKDIFPRTSDWWASYFDYWNFMYWSGNMNDLKNLIFGDSQGDINFKDDLKSKIQTMLDIVKNTGIWS